MSAILAETDHLARTKLAESFAIGESEPPVFDTGDALAEDPPDAPLTVPLGVAQFAGDLASVRAFAEHTYPSLRSWTSYDRGGHYAAHNAPELLVRDLRGFFGGLRG